jgi:hypothetical protein
MPTSYSKNKEHIYKWREGHKQQWNEYMLKINMERYYNHKEEYNQKRRELYLLRKNPYFGECEIFRRILL